MSDFESIDDILYGNEEQPVDQRPSDLSDSESDEEVSRSHAGVSSRSSANVQEEPVAGPSWAINEMLSSVISLNKSREDEAEEDSIEKFYSAACCMSKCNEKIPPNIAIETHQSFKELSKVEQDVLLKGHLDCLHQHAALTEIYQFEKSKQAAKRAAARETSRQGIHYYLFRQVPICRKMYCFLHDVKKDRYLNVVNDFDEYGLGPREHKLTGQTPTRTKRIYSLADAEGMAKFLHGFAAKYAIALPGRLPNYKNYRIMKLPSSFTKVSVYRKYVKIKVLCAKKSFFEKMA